LVYVVITLRNAWAVEEAYIAFRVVDNLVHGYGLRFSTNERVCAVTNPLCTLTMAAATSVTHEVWFTSLGIELVLAVLTASLLARSTSTVGAICALLALSLSKAYVDWTTRRRQDLAGASGTIRGSGGKPLGRAPLLGAWGAWRRTKRS
jgi:hypothetical protein